MKPWKKLLILFFVFLFYVFLCVFIKPDYSWNFDFSVNWNTIVNISKGTPLYEQKYWTMYGFPYHVPLYFYFIAFLVWLFGEYYIINKIYLIICIFCVALLLEHIVKNSKNDKLENKKIRDYTSFVFLLNPFVIIHTITGLFDGLALLYLLIGYFLIHKTLTETSRKRFLLSFLSGLSIGVGFLTKIIPLVFLPLGFLILLYRKKILETICFTVGFFSISGSLMAFLLIKYPNFWHIGFGWQINRESVSFSFFSYFLDLTFFYNLILLGLGFFCILYIFSTDVFRKEKINLFIYTGMFASVFFILYRVFYPGYLLWFIPFLAYISIKMIEEKKYKKLIMLITIFCIELIAIGLWETQFFPIFTLSWGAMAALSVVNSICLIAYLIFLSDYRIINDDKLEIKEDFKKAS